MTTIHLNLFTGASPAHQFKGQWKHPEDRTATGYRSLDYWIEIARIAERGLFDAVFFADSLGLYDTYGGDERVAIRHAVQVPAIDPVLLIPALASATTHLGFAVTYSTTYHSPYQTAKVFSSLDHLTGGRVGWNIVTSYLQNAIANGLGESLPHDVRYDRADEYMDVVYELWERSWDEDAVVLDSAGDVFTDPDRVHRIEHAGTWFNVRGPHQVEPSIQRTPVLYQAGASDKGTEFAARHAEALFITPPNLDRCRAYVDSVRGLAERNGRDPSSLKIFFGVRLMVGADEESAAQDAALMRRMASDEGSLALWSGWTGVDLGSLDPDALLADMRIEGMQSTARALQQRDPDRAWTIRDVREALVSAVFTCRFVGSATQVADDMERWLETGIDGFNLMTPIHPAGIERIVDHLVPELQRRGLYRTEYESSTLREHYFGAGRCRLHPSHPGRKPTE